MENLKYSIQGHQGTVTLHVTPLKINSIIFGNTWLAKYNPDFNWKTRTARFRDSNPEVTIKANTKNDLKWITPKEASAIIAEDKENTLIYRVELDTTDDHEKAFYDKYRKESEDQRLTKLLEEYDDIFREKLPKAAPKYRSVVHNIPLKPGAKPIQMYQYRLSPQHCEILQKQIDELLELGHIEHSKSPWRFPLLVVTKKDGKPRGVEDLRGLNYLTICKD